MAITKEDLQEFIQDEANKELFEEIAKVAGYESQEAITGLKNKNYELLSKMKKSKEERDIIQKQLDNIDIDGYNEYVNKSSSGKADENKANRDLLRLQEQLKQTVENNSKLESELNNNIINSRLSSIFDEIGIDPKHKSLLTSAYLSKAKVEIDDNTRQVVINNGDGLELPAKDYFTQWSDTDQGREYLRKQDNNGANSRSFNKAGSRTIKKADFDRLTPSEKMKAVKDLQVVD